MERLDRAEVGALIDACTGYNPHPLCRDARYARPAIPARIGEVLLQRLTTAWDLVVASLHHAIACLFGAGGQSPAVSEWISALPQTYGPAEGADASRHAP